MTIQLFGIAKEIIGDKQLTIPDDKNINHVNALKQYLSQHFPSLQTLPSWTIAVDGECANNTTLIHNNSEIALLPPVSGG